MISADTNADKVSQCIELCVDDYLPKPFNLTILRARIGAALRRQSLCMLESEYLGKIENEKRHSENPLRNILPAEIATRLCNRESNIADHFDDTTVIFADVVAWSTPTPLAAKQATSSHAAVDSGIPRETVDGESTRQ